MFNISDALENLVTELTRLPSIGRKTAQRLAMFIIKQPRDEAERLARSLIEVKDKIKFCRICCNITEDETCRICTSDKRDKTVICVVEEPQDVYAIEKTNEYKGLYHVLHGRISPLEGIGPNEVRIKELLYRLEDDSKNEIKELILALNPTVEGETTILYLGKIIKPLGIKLTRIARGIPIGSDIELTDQVTLAKAIEGRVSL
ncbi:MAG: recombination mediator RecR [Ignavibacteria bacterium]|jgi:recombination protein RecR|nr:recombination mediator RecR [Ignavibacteria bacterium]